MIKIVIGTLVGGLILFFWQFISWGVGNLHGDQIAHTPLQEQLLSCLESAGLPEGEYFIPNKPPEMSQEEYGKIVEEKWIGKPWARIQYHHNFQNTMPMNMFRGLVIDLLAAFLVCVLLVGDPTLGFRKCLTACLSIGIIAYLTIPYLSSIWFKTNSLPDLVDAVVPWLLIGLAFGKILPNRNRVNG